MQEAESGDYKIIEINPRTPASLKASLASGVDFPAIILYDTLGHPVPKFKYEPGKILRYMGLDVMWFLFSPDRFRIRPSWFKFFGRNIYYEDGTWSDPLPMLAGCFAGVIKYLNPKFRKSKLN
jgi:predicted ATP-grasp superfamily ATP-dependent carboligase